MTRYVALRQMPEEKAGEEDAPNFEVERTIDTILLGTEDGRQMLSHSTCLANATVPLHVKITRALLAANSVQIGCAAGLWL